MKTNRLTKMTALLLGISILLYVLQMIFISDVKTTVNSLFQNLAFLPIYILLATVVFETLITARDKALHISKINILVNEFYIEIGTEIIEHLNPFVVNLNEVSDIIDFKTNWTEKDFTLAIKKMKALDLHINPAQADLKQLGDFLSANKSIILSLFKNPNLLEHDDFTEMLWSVFHIFDELRSRPSLENLPEQDMNHLSIDIKRGYQFILIELIYCMKQQKAKYPYLFSLTLRKKSS